MKKTTSITYNIETDGGLSTTELEYKDYVKNVKGEENLLHYKVKNVKNCDELRAIKDARAYGDVRAYGDDAGDATDAAETSSETSKETSTETSKETSTETSTETSKETSTETFNKIYKVDDTIDETVGVSINNDDWRIHEYKNHKLDKEYAQEYDTIKFDIKSDLLENYKKRGYIENTDIYKDI